MGQARSLGILAIPALVISIGLLLVPLVGDASLAPVGGAGIFSFNALGQPISKRYIGRTLPSLPEKVTTQQGTAPDADLNVNAYSSEERAPFAAPNRTINRVVFSSNGFTVDEDSIGPIAGTNPDDKTPNFNLWIMRPDGSDQVKLTDFNGDEIQPAYSPGGNVVAFSSNRSGRWEIYIIEVRNPTAIQCLTDRQPGNKQHPTWSADGLFIAYQCDAAGNWDIYKLPASGASAQIQLTTNLDDDTDPAWIPDANPLSADAQAIAYTYHSGGSTRIHWVDARTAVDSALTSGGGGNDKEPAWYKNATELAFSSSRLTGGADATPDYNIWRIRSAGETGGQTPFLVSNTDSSDTVDDTNPAWDSLPPFGQPMRIFYESTRLHDTAGGPSNSLDIWGTLYADTDAPFLDELPSVDNRLVSPGSKITFYVKAHDEDSGVASVTVHVKDPDLKQWATFGRDFESGLAGTQSLEVGYTRVTGSGGVALYDDGDMANHGDAVAGDGLFSGTWTTLAQASDYVIDVTLTDKTNNRITYDSVYGFTTMPFTPKANILFVNDYCEGQQFISQRGFNNDSTSWYYTESFYTRNPSTTASSGIDFDSIADSYGESYDVWRVICRGPIPTSVYTYYLPSVEYQLDPEEAVSDYVNAKPTRALKVAARVVLWASPHTGNVWVADGSIVDASTQADLSLFLDRGGRLFISGGDLAWALTLNGTVTNSFLQNYLKANFVRDVAASKGYTVAGTAGDPVLSGTFGHFPHAEEYPVSLNTPLLTYIPNSYFHDAQEDLTELVVPDVITVDSSAVKLYGYNGAAGEAAGLRYENAETSSKLVYLAFPFEQIHRGHHSTSDMPMHCKNHRSHLLHLAFCWMRTAGFRGQVLPIDSGKPLTNPAPIVYLWIGGHTLGDKNDLPDYAVRCQDDGRYEISGIPTGSYTMEAFRPGYSVDHAEGATTHGGLPPAQQDFAIYQARPGAVVGKVTSEATGESLALVSIKAWPVPVSDGEEDEEIVEPDWDTLGTPTASATSAADGTYTLSDLPIGDYYVRADGTSINYGTKWEVVTITAGNTTTLDFALPAEDGNLIVTVTSATTLAPIFNARVECTVEGTSGVPVIATTDTNGQVTIPLQPGSYTIVVKASGYEVSEPQGVTIVSSTDATVEFALQPEPPGTITGRLISASSGNPVADVTVELVSNGSVIATAVTTGTLTTPTGGQPYNYIFNNASTGSLIVRPVLNGFTATPASKTVTVESGKTTANVNFSLTSLHTFPSGLQLISFPYDYSAMGDSASILGLDPADLKMATWDPVLKDYRIYPATPADRILSGVGYWTRFASQIDLTRQGVTLTGDFNIPVKAGWNLIGDPFTSNVNFYAIKVKDRFGSTYTASEALSSGLLQSGLFSYILGGYRDTTILSPWVGNWVKVQDDATIIIPEVGTVASAVAPKIAAEDGWMTSVNVAVNGMIDTSSHFGVARGATAVYDAGLDSAKPPVANFGPYVYSAFIGSDAESYGADIRSIGDATPEWTMSVATSAVGDVITLSWPDLSDVPTATRLFIKDTVTGRVTAMRSASHYSYTATEDARTFKISLVPEGSLLSVSGVRSEATKAGVCNIVYTLSCPATVDVTVMNVAGRVVSHVVTARVSDAGINSLSWDARGTNGNKLPAGRYLVQLSAHTEDGQVIQAVTPMMLVR